MNMIITVNHYTTLKRHLTMSGPGGFMGYGNLLGFRAIVSKQKVCVDFQVKKLLKSLHPRKENSGQQTFCGHMYKSKTALYRHVNCPDFSRTVPILA